jgi:hypothetical protein
MQHSDGLDLRRQWGDKPCNHQQLEPEYFDDTPTGDFLCKDCGKVFEAWEANKSKQRSDDEE